MPDEQLSKRVANACFEKGLIIERTGRRRAILKILPPLTITDEHLIKGIKIITSSVGDCVN